MKYLSKETMKDKEKELGEYVVRLLKEQPPPDVNTLDVYTYETWCADLMPAIEGKAQRLGLIKEKTQA